MNRVASSRERGIALILVLWVSAVLALLGAGFAQLTRIESTRVSVTEAGAAARALLDAGLAYAVIGLRQPDPAARWHADGSVHQIVRPNARVQVQAWDERGRIDLNRAPAGVVRALVARAVPDAAAAARVSAAILDRRPDVAGAGANLSFRDITELALLPGIDAEAYRRLALATTVHNPLGIVSAWTAPPAALEAFSALAEGDREALLAQRQQNTYSPDPGLGRRLAMAGLSLTNDPPAVVTVRVVVTLQDGSGGRASAEAVVWLKPVAPVGWRVLQWREPLPE